VQQFAARVDGISDRDEMFSVERAFDPVGMPGSRGGG
jgi:hypothetical protein